MAKIIHNPSYFALHNLNTDVNNNGLGVIIVKHFKRRVIKVSRKGKPAFAILQASFSPLHPLSPERLYFDGRLFLTSQKIKFSHQLLHKF